MLSPLEYKASYDIIYAPLPNGLDLPIRLNKYLNTRNRTNWANVFWNFSHALATALGMKCLPTPDFQIAGRTMNRRSLQLPHAGKGSPSNIKDVLWALAFCLGYGRARLSSNQEKTIIASFRSTLAGFIPAVMPTFETECIPQESTSRTDFRVFLSAVLQRYCDNNIGLDCSGFAENYYGLPQSRWHCGEFYWEWKKTPGATATSINEISERDALVWLQNEHDHHGQHVAVVNRILGTGEESADVEIVEATAFIDNDSLVQGVVAHPVKIVEGPPTSLSKGLIAKTGNFHSTEGDVLHKRSLLHITHPPADPQPRC